MRFWGPFFLSLRACWSGRERSTSHGLRIWGARGGGRLRILSSVCEWVCLSGPPKRKKWNFQKFRSFCANGGNLLFCAEIRANGDISLNLSQNHIFAFWGLRMIKKRQGICVFWASGPQKRTKSQISQKCWNLIKFAKKEYLGAFLAFYAFWSSKCVFWAQWLKSLWE